MSFKNYDLRVAIQEKLDTEYSDSDLLDLVDMTELEVCEYWADEYHAISSEQELSDLFDDEIAPAIIETFGDDDKPAMREAFNNWTDSMCRDHMIADIQYQEYTYVGKHDID